MAETLTHIPVLASLRRQAPRMKRLSFGNSYTQKYGDGLNTNPQSWDVEFDEDDTGKQSLEALFVASFTTYFIWTPPETGSSESHYECLDWTVGFLGAGNYKITATFIEWFGPA